MSTRKATFGRFPLNAPRRSAVHRRWPASWWLSLLLAAALATGCKSAPKADVSKTLVPSNYRDWEPSLAVLPKAKIQRDRLTVYNIRNCNYLTEDDYIVDYYDKTFDLDELQTVDFIVVPFKDTPALAHTMLSFGFGPQGYLAVSVEARLEKGEAYSPLLGALRQYELMYVLADERDLIRLRTEHRQVDVYVYRTKATPQQAHALLVDVLKRVNHLAKEPEFYDTFTNNCTSNLVSHFNVIRPGGVSLADLRVLLPGYSDRLAYDLGLIDTKLPFEAARREARINELAHRYADSPDFSQKIRR